MRALRSCVHAGVPVRATNYLGVPHGYASFPGVTSVGWQARSEFIEQIRWALHDS